ncbi:MAG: hypothetical protein C0394_02810 [Syntrophus sp. (in: bacteria)]|nr:hypothetical protein [Syntrophus sp. (in: bacteria)]
MRKNFRTVVFYISAVAVFCLFASPCRADVLFIHDFKTTDYLIGKQEADLLMGYTDQAMFIDKNIRYTGKMMTTLYGKVHEGRETTHFLLDKDQIRQIDYHKGKIIVFPFKRLTDVNWIKQKQRISEAEAEIIRERYRVSEPVLSVKILPKKEEINGYACQVVEADLRLETIDIKRNSSSVTLVKQKLWVSEAVPGYDQYKAFHEKLAKRLGFDAARLGGLSGMLRYWDGSLDPVRKSIKDVKGYPVKSIIRVEGRYTAGIGTASAKTSSVQMEEEFVELREALIDKPIKVRFAEPSGFGVTVVE